jgi:hypothetical protein
LSIGRALPINSPLDGLGSWRQFAGLALFVHLDALQIGLGWLLILLLLRMVFRSDRMAIIVSIMVTAPLIMQVGNHIALEILLGALITALSLFGLLRFGLLSLVVELSFSSAMFFLPVSLDPSDWYQARSMLVLLGLAAVAAYGAYNSVEASRHREVRLE